MFGRDQNEHSNTHFAASVPAAYTEPDLCIVSFDLSKPRSSPSEIC